MMAKVRGIGEKLWQENRSCIGSLIRATAPASEFPPHSRIIADHPLSGHRSASALECDLTFCFFDEIIRGPGHVGGEIIAPRD